MKILIKNGFKKPLPVGDHMVVISKIHTGITENGIEYFDCVFQNNEGACSSRYFITEEEMFRIIALFRACHLPAEHNKTVDTDDLIRTPLVIENLMKLRDGIQFVDTVGIFPMPENTIVSSESNFEDD